MSEAQTPTLQAVLEGAVRSLLSGVRQCLPAAVVDYDEGARKATVQPLLQEAYTDAEGNRQVASLPPITNVPVLFPGSGQTRVRWPVKAGDTVLLLFASASLDRWLVRGGTVDPQDDRRHDLNDAVALPGFLSFNQAGDHDVMIEFTPSGEIHAGGSRKLALHDDLAAVSNKLDAHVHQSAAPTLPTTPPVVLPLAPNPSVPGTFLPGVTAPSTTLAGTNVLKGA